MFIVKFVQIYLMLFTQRGEGEGFKSYGVGDGGGGGLRDKLRVLELMYVQFLYRQFHLINK